MEKTRITVVQVEEKKGEKGPMRIKSADNEWYSLFDMALAPVLQVGMTADTE